MKIAITGVAGFVGSNLTERLLGRGDVVSGIDDLSHGSLENVGELLDHPSFHFSNGTILDPEALRNAFKGAEVVVHLAAGKIPRHADALDTLLINGEGGLHTLRAVHACGVRRMVLASTSDCYGRNPQVPFSEESASVIGSPKVRRWSYAVSKMFEEQALFAFKDTGSRAWRCGFSEATARGRTSPGGAGRNRCSSGPRSGASPSRFTARASRRGASLSSTTWWRGSCAPSIRRRRMARS